MFSDNLKKENGVFLSNSKHRLGLPHTPSFKKVKNVRRPKDKESAIDETVNRKRSKLVTVKPSKVIHRVTFPDEKKPFVNLPPRKASSGEFKAALKIRYPGIKTTGKEEGGKSAKEISKSKELVKLEELNEHLEEVKVATDSFATSVGNLGYKEAIADREAFHGGITLKDFVKVTSNLEMW